MELTKFEDKFVPPYFADPIKVTQDEFCDSSSCSDFEEVDCGNCLFDKKRCKIELFEQWKSQRETEQKEDE